MHDQLERAVLAAAEGGAPPKTWEAGSQAAVEFGTGRNPFDGAQVTAWIDSFDAAAVAAGRSE
ncbi:hypothetical protein [Mycolicibacterium tusciae]|uniref:Uncharacterized protein n=1 Tax=Mycolicibacterium tusciae TaxID=75922 RepID=A0A1X0JXQ6_9MYCO|nr:hypothetical protein [Mycolicibacterium tusciae]ORB67684.1 hypothetical protein BST47_04185 [Mycolicibacterium tusciae]